MNTDTLYYIMDYKGNYYQVDKNDQLVAVGYDYEATLFTFAQANSRIGVGRKASFYCMISVEEKAEEKEVNTEEMVEAANEPVSSIKELAYDEITEPVEKNVSSYDLAEMDWGEYLTHFTYIVEGLKKYRDELAKKHSDIDQKICDILHYIELCETNEDEAADLIELLRVCRESRREIKDELQRIEYFQSNLGTNANAAKARQALKSIKGLETRKYKPRKYEELFENCVLKDRRIQKEDICESDKHDAVRKQIIKGKTKFDDIGGEDTMTEEKIYTPFDGKQNDWLAFAKQQTEFYRNAGQYITNLQIEIREIDDEIEDILLETEEANCNVAQGYKVFKRLKELRLEKKAKNKELNCLYALTDYIDCEAMADTCEENLKEVEDILDVTEHDESAEHQIEDNSQQLHIVSDFENMVG